MMTTIKDHKIDHKSDHNISTAPNASLGDVDSEFSVIGVVAIGRNEGDRLRRCLASLKPFGFAATVYVDSGSSDGSVDMARAMGAHIVTLDMSIPFTAARARNAGVERLVSLYPDIDFIQFIDGDCDIDHDWPRHALHFLQSHSEYGVVCGRRREKFPHASLYNYFCDLEWNTPVGEAKACGGDSIMRRDIFEAMDGFDARLIAGEEPELCLRIRRAGAKIMRLPVDMTYHDADLTKFSQWWQRARRGGYAYAIGFLKHGFGPEPFNRAALRRIFMWSSIVPVSGILSIISPLFLWLLLAYPLQIARLTWRHKGKMTHPFLRAVFLVLGQFSEAIGALEAFLRHVMGRSSRQLIEYK